MLFPLAVVGTIGLLLFPIPSGVLDVLLAANLSFSLVLLLGTLYQRAPERFTSLPTLLLLSTLYRLGLNIATTRQILGAGTAPEIVRAFGEFVVQGNIGVGVVIFAIISVIQFLVIAKGGERVAEVAARFALDAMPGRQMSIDADLRAGMLSVGEARERRRELQRECKLFGALDGAMKFVKGDAIACNVIVVVNIVAGIAIGTVSHGLSPMEAIRRFTLFTIGDGLVSQVPALLVAVSAGIAVTRVSDRENSLLGREIGEQLTREPFVLAASGVVIGMCALIPGFPGISLGAIGLLALVSAGRTVRRQDERESAQRSFRPSPIPPVLLVVTLPLARRLQQEGGIGGLGVTIRRDIFRQWGVLLPELPFEVDTTGENEGVEVLLSGARAGRVPLARGEVTSQLAPAVNGILCNSLVSLIDDAQTRSLLELYQPCCGELVTTALPTAQDITRLTAVLRELIREQIPIREFRGILQALAELRTRSADDHEVLVCVRTAIRRTISDLVSEGKGALSVWILHPEADFLLSRVYLQRMALEPRLADELEAQVKELMAAEYSQQLIVMATPHARPLVARALHALLPAVRAVAPEEVVPSLKISIAGELHLKQLPARTVVSAAT